VRLYSRYIVSNRLLCPKKRSCLLRCFTVAPVAENPAMLLARMVTPEGLRSMGELEPVVVGDERGLQKMG
jgi:hypothetical protein